MLRQVGNISEALISGTTLPSRFFMSWAMVFYGVGFFINQPTWLSNPSFYNLNQILTLKHWGIAYFTAGLLGLWRVHTSVPNIYAAYFVNAAIFTVWNTAAIIRICGIGSLSLASMHTGWWIISFWCLIRTAATERDKRTT